MSTPTTPNYHRPHLRKMPIFAWEDVESPEIELDSLLATTRVSSWFNPRLSPDATPFYPSSEPKPESEPESEPESKPESETDWTDVNSGRKKKRKQAMLARRIKASEADMRTVFLTDAEKRQIQATCERNNVRGLRTGQWKRGDGTIHTTGHTLCYARGGEWGAYLMVREEFAGNPAFAGWIVERPDFENRTGYERDRGDLKVIKPDGSTIWIEVKTITNRGGYNKHDINKAGKLGYVFQRLKWTFSTKKLELTPTFDKNHKEHEHVMNSLLVGVVCTPLKGGSLAFTISKSVFLKPISECKWSKLKYTSKKDAGLKRRTIDPAVV